MGSLSSVVVDTVSIVSIIFNLFSVFVISDGTRSQIDFDVVVLFAFGELNHIDVCFVSVIDFLEVCIELLLKFQVFGCSRVRFCTSSFLQFCSVGPSDQIDDGVLVGAIESDADFGFPVRGRLVGVQEVKIEVQVHLFALRKSIVQ